MINPDQWMHSVVWLALRWVNRAWGFGTMQVARALIAVTFGCVMKLSIDTHWQSGVDAFCAVAITLGLMMDFRRTFKVEASDGTVRQRFVFGFTAPGRIFFLILVIVGIAGFWLRASRENVNLVMSFVVDFLIALFSYVVDGPPLARQRSRVLAAIKAGFAKRTEVSS